MPLLSSRSASSFQVGVTTARTVIGRLIVSVVPSDMELNQVAEGSQPQRWRSITGEPPCGPWSWGSTAVEVLNRHGIARRDPIASLFQRLSEKAVLNAEWLHNGDPGQPLITS